MSSRIKHIKEQTYFNETSLFLSVLENRNLLLFMLIRPQRAFENRLRTVSFDPKGTFPVVRHDWIN